jgi:hypothetical protein
MSIVLGTIMISGTHMQHHRLPLPPWINNGISFIAINDVFAPKTIEKGIKIDDV